MAGFARQVSFQDMGVPITWLAIFILWKTWNAGVVGTKIPDRVQISLMAG
ncbi:MAG: hypothetical protein KJ622_05735 [Alphaproteobacteria bacterium]|nr:hypothetical protein [Alphaproteobacteria bacterium]